MIRKLVAVSVVALAALTSCSSETDEDATTPVETTPSQSATDDSDGSGTMEVVDGVATSSDGRYDITTADGWQPYPAPLDDSVNITLLLISDVNEAEFVANVIGTWTPEGATAPSNFDEWMSAAETAFGDEATTTEPATDITIDGETISGLTIRRTIDGVDIVQVVYPVFADGGYQELAFSASPDTYDEQLDVVLDMFSSVTAN